MIAGTPQDAFSDDGQLWGNPLYSWTMHKEEKYAWWCSRIKRALELHDEIRIDHFQGIFQLIGQCKLAKKRRKPAHGTMDQV